MASSLHFTLVSPERELFSGAVDQVVAPGEQGDFGVLAGHAPFMATLRLGALTIFEGGSTRRIFVAGGFADVTPDGLTVLAEKAMPMDELDAAGLDAQLNEARGAVDAAGDDGARALAGARVEEISAMIAALNDTAYG